MEWSTESPARLVVARATVNLHGFPVGERRIVDANDPTVADLVEHEFLILDDEAET